MLVEVNVVVLSSGLVVLYALVQVHVHQHRSFLYLSVR